MSPSIAALPALSPSQLLVLLGNLLPIGRLSPQTCPASTLPIRSSSKFLVHDGIFVSFPCASANAVFFPFSLSLLLSGRNSGNSGGGAPSHLFGEPELKRR